MSEKEHLPASGRINVLPEQVAHKIAAGEVIERPASVVRELLDNSIDAGSSRIDLHVTDGGVREIRVVDNGGGMTEEDLKLCFLPHTTSKIASAEDLLRISTLGFRGEALSSIAASAEVDITSRLQNVSGEAVKVRISRGQLVYLGPEKGSAGTTVVVRNLFHTIPARRQFLKQPSAEGRMCRQTFIEKALPFPNIQFRYFSGDRRPLLLPPGTLRERVVTAYGNFLSHSGTVEWSETLDDTLRVDLILSYPEVYRHDRRYIHIYVNSRKIDEYGLLQAVVHGYGDFLPGGRFPYAFVFIDIDPALADFNIHPAKKEVRFRNRAGVHHAVSESVRAALYAAVSSGPQRQVDTPGGRRPAGSRPERDAGLYSGGPEWGAGAAEQPGTDSRRFTGSVEKLRRSFPDFPKRPGPVHSGPGQAETGFTASDQAHPDPDGISYKGQLFGMFLLASSGESFFIIDQHAAHERILYNRFTASPPQPQKLLVPFYFEVDEGENRLLEKSAQQFAELGVELEEAGKLRWRIISFPYPGGKSSVDPVGFVREHITRMQDVKKEFFSRLACKAAVKEGEILTPSDALNLIRDTFSLPEPRCPHGRPVWYRLEKDELCRLVGRKV